MGPVTFSRDRQHSGSWKRGRKGNAKLGGGKKSKQHKSCAACGFTRSREQHCIRAPTGIIPAAHCVCGDPEMSSFG